MSPTYGHVKKLFLNRRIGIPTQRKLTNKKNANSQLNLAVFLAGTGSKNKNYVNTTQKRTKKFGQNCHHLDSNLPLRVDVLASWQTGKPKTSR